MAKRDFDEYVDGLRFALSEDAASLKKMKEDMIGGLADENMVKSAEKAYKDDATRLNWLLFAKSLLDKPTRVRKQARWKKQSKLPQTPPTIS